MTTSTRLPSAHSAVAPMPTGDAASAVSTKATTNVAQASAATPAPAVPAPVADGVDAAAGEAKLAEDLTPLHLGQAASTEVLKELKAVLVKMGAAGGVEQAALGDVDIVLKQMSSGEIAHELKGLLGQVLEQLGSKDAALNPAMLELVAGLEAKLGGLPDDVAPKLIQAGWLGEVLRGTSEPVLGSVLKFVKAVGSSLENAQTKSFPQAFKSTLASAPPGFGTGSAGMHPFWEDNWPLSDDDDNESWSEGFFGDWLNQDNDDQPWPWEDAKPSNSPKWSSVADDLAKAVKNLEQVNFSVATSKTTSGSGPDLIDKTGDAFATQALEAFKQLTPEEQKALQKDWQKNGIEITVKVNEKDGFFLDDKHSKTLKFRPMFPGESVGAYMQAAAKWAAGIMKKEVQKGEFFEFGPDKDITSVSFSMKDTAFYDKQAKLKFRPSIASALKGILNKGVTLKPGVFKPGPLFRIPQPGAWIPPAGGGAPGPAPLPAGSHYAKHIGDVNEFVMYVIRESYLETTKDLMHYAEKVQFFNKLKKEIRAELNTIKEELAQYAGEDDLYPVMYEKYEFPKTPVTGEDGSQVVGEKYYVGDCETKADLTAYMDKLEQDLSQVGDDAQLANVDVQNWLQKQQQTLQMLSNISKSAHDTALATIRKIGG